MSHVFISYAQEQRDAANLLRIEFERRGIRSWWAADDIRPGERWLEALSNAIRAADLVVVLISDAALTSEWVQNELLLAQRSKVPVVPARVDRADVEGSALALYLGGIQWLDHSSGLSPAAARELATVVSRRLEAPEPVPDSATPAEAPPSQDDSFALRVDRSNPAYFALVLDCSNSMHERVSENGLAKREVVARTVNDLLDTLVMRATKEDSIRHYFDVTALGYGLGDGGKVASLLPADIVPVDELAELARFERAEEVIEGPDGEITVPVDRAVWITPTAMRRGRTVTRTAFEHLHPLVGRWIGQHPKGLPPIVLHVTDGGWNRGEEPHAAIRALQELRTSRGNVLVFNCHLTRPQAGTASLVFPGSLATDEFSSKMIDLFDLSSKLPAPMHRLATDSGYQLADNARGYVLNADAAVLADFLDIGTRGATLGA